MPRAVVQKENRSNQASHRKLARLYEIDEIAWLEEMCRLIEERRYDELDYKNLSEYLTEMARRDRREVHQCRLRGRIDRGRGRCHRQSRRR